MWKYLLSEHELRKHLCLWSTFFFFKISIITCSQHFFVLKFKFFSKLFPIFSRKFTKSAVSYKTIVRRKVLVRCCSLDCFTLYFEQWLIVPYQSYFKQYFTTNELHGVRIESNVFALLSSFSVFEDRLEIRMMVHAAGEINMYPGWLGWLTELIILEIGFEIRKTHI